MTRWKLVPETATDEMCEHGRLRDPLGCDIDDGDVRAVYSGAWRGMLSATPPYSPSPEMVERVARAIMDAGLARGTEYDMARAAITAFIEG
jgi:hypothetical protein